jgi:ATP-dependent HslUV protease ATP-binding subunit HslU
VGYVGRDAESMVRDLADAAINMVRTEREDEVYPQAEERADERLLDLLLPPPPPQPPDAAEKAGKAGASVFIVSPKGQAKSERAVTADDERRQRSREKLRQMLAEGRLDDREVEIEVTAQGYPGLEMLQPPQGMEGADINFTEWLQDMLPKRQKRRTVKVPEARRVLVDEELKKLVDMDDVVNEALDRVENHGIIFIDELDKIAGGTVGPPWDRTSHVRAYSATSCRSSRDLRYKPDTVTSDRSHPVHRRRCLPRSKPSDLIPELQGRFPIMGGRGCSR